MEEIETIFKLREEIRKIEERLTAIEREQRMIREDILSGEPKERMQKRILQKQPKTKEKKEKIDKEIRIKI
jgi:hypothetical protein